jgi:hypothetical protein
MKQILTIAIVLLYAIAYSQNTGDELYMGFPDVLPNSPEAASLGKYNDIPVGLFTGTPNITIPLYEIKIDEFKLPIYLNYSSNGIKVDQISSNVGLGWTLFSGGIITRSLNNNADEDYRLYLPNANYSSEEMQDFLEDINNNSDQRDTEPDIFSYNFNGHSGKFYLDENFEPMLIEPSDIKIEKLSGFGIENTTEYAFSVTTSDGIAYWFGGLNAVESSYLMTSSGGNHTEATESIQNAWYLALITFPNNNESITFNYVNGFANHVSSISQNVKATKVTDEGINGGYPSYFCGSLFSTEIITNVYPLEARITNISWASGYIDFIYSSRYSVGNFKKLDAISIFNDEEDIVKSYSFDYLQIDCDLTFNNPDFPSLSDETIYKRLFLSSLQEVTSNINQPNPYIFEYYSPEELPPRLSYAQDFWGYFNGKNNSDLIPDDLSYFEENWYNSIDVSFEELSPVFQNVGGDKTPDSQYGIKGLLKSVIYPTGGAINIEYEANNIYTLEHQPAEPETINLTVDTDENTWSDEDTYTTNPIPYIQYYVPIDCSVGTTACWDPNNPTPWKKMSISISDLTDNVNAPVFTYNSTTCQYYPVMESELPLQITPNSDNSYYVIYLEDHVYEFKIGIVKPCLTGNFSTSLYTENGQEVYINKEVGGLRVKKIKRNDSYGAENIRSFYYGAWGDLNSSSGILEPIKPAISYYSERSYYWSAENYFERDETTISLSSSSLFSISNFQGNHINYETVIEGLGNNFENGAIVHKYKIEQDEYPNIFSDPVLGTPNTNLSFENGKEIETITYRNDNGTFLKTNKTLNYYTNDNSLQNTIQGFSTSASFNYTSIGFMKSNLCTYNINTQWHYLYKSDDYIYDKNGLNPILTSTNYFYDNENHLQLTRKQTTDSKGNILKDYYYYPGDYDNIENFSTLIGKNIISKPVKTFSTNNNKITDGNIYKYNDNGSLIEENKYENSSLLAKPAHDPSVVTSIPDYFHRKAEITYHPVTKKPIEYLSVDNYPVTYLWGYNNTQVVAKIENEIFDVVEPLLDCTYEELQDKTDSELMIIFENLRAVLTDAMISSYTYAPLVGIKTETYPSGKTIFYDYDDFNRLETIKDQDGNIIKHIDYHYKDQ